MDGLSRSASIYRLAPCLMSENGQGKSGSVWNTDCGLQTADEREKCQLRDEGFKMYIVLFLISSTKRKLTDLGIIQANRSECLHSS